MARTLITPQAVGTAGLAETYEPANAAGNAVALAAGRLVRIKNGGGTTCNVTIPTPMQVDGLDVTDRTYAIAAGASLSIAIGSNVRDVYAQPGGVAWLNYDQVTTVTVAVLSVPN